MYTPLPEQLPKCSLVKCTVVEIVIIVHHAKQTLIKDLGAAKTVKYKRPNRWAYATYTLHEFGHNQREKGVSLYYVMGVFYVFYGKLKMYQKK